MTESHPIQQSLGMRCPREFASGAFRNSTLWPDQGGHASSKSLSWRESNLRTVAFMRQNDGPHEVICQLPKADRRSQRRHHPHHAEMRGLAAPSASDQTSRRPLCHFGRQGHRRIPGPPPRHPSPPHAPCSLGLPICNSRRSCHLGMKGELPLATRGDEGSSRPSAAQALPFLRWRWGMKVEGVGLWLGSGKAVYHVYNHKLIFL
jgi:hypothetical protein